MCLDTIINFFSMSNCYHFSLIIPPLTLWCLNMLLLKATNENLPPNVIKQLAKELKNLDESPPEGIKVGVNDDDFSTIYADIEGPGMCLSFLIYNC